MIGWLTGTIAVICAMVVVALLVSVLELAPDQPCALLGECSLFIPLWRPDPGV